MNHTINCCDYLEKILVLDQRVLYREISIVVISIVYTFITSDHTAGINKAL